MDETTYREIVNGFIAECREDYVGLWEFVGELDLASSVELSDMEVRSKALELARDLLEAGMLAGDFTQEGFFPWNLSIDDALGRIEAEWNQLNVRSPNPFEIVAFVAP